MKIFGVYSRPLGFILESYKNHKIVIVLSIIAIIFESIFSILLPILAKLEMDQLAEKNEELFGIITASSFNIFIIILAIIFLGQFVNHLLLGILNILKENYTEKMRNDVHERTIARLKNMEIGLAMNVSTERFLQESISNGHSLPHLLEQFFTENISEIIKIIGISTVFFMIDWRIFAVLIVSMMLSGFLQKFSRRLMEREHLELDYKTDYEVRMIGHAFETSLAPLVSSGGFSTQLAHLKNINATRLAKKRKYQWKYF